MNSMLEAHVSLGEDSKANRSAHVSLGQDFELDVGAYVSLGEDFRVGCLDSSQIVGRLSPTCLHRGKQMGMDGRVGWLQ